MAHGLVEADTFTATVTVPDDGDTASAASVETPFQALANRTNWLENRVLAAGGSTKVLHVAPSLATNVTWSAVNACWLMGGATRGDIYFPIPWQLGASLVSVTLTHTPTAGSFAAAVTLTQMQIVSKTISTGAVATIDTQVDPAGAAGAYDILHSFTLTCAALRAMTSDIYYYLRIFEDDSAIAGGATLDGITYVVQPT